MNNLNAIPAVSAANLAKDIYDLVKKDAPLELTIQTLQKSMHRFLVWMRKT